MSIESRILFIGILLGMNIFGGGLLMYDILSDDDTLPFIKDIPKLELTSSDVKQTYTSSIVFGNGYDRNNKMIYYPYDLRLEKFEEGFELVCKSDWMNNIRKFSETCVISPDVKISRVYHKSLYSDFSWMLIAEDGCVDYYMEYRDGDLLQSNHDEITGKTSCYFPVKYYNASPSEFGYVMFELDDDYRMLIR